MIARLKRRFSDDSLNWKGDEWVSENSWFSAYKVHEAYVPVHESGSNNVKETSAAPTALHVEQQNSRFIDRAGRDITKDDGDIGKFLSELKKLRDGVVDPYSPLIVGQPKE